MGIFDKLFGEKGNCCNAETKKTNCSCGGDCNSLNKDTIEIRILGSGCKNCQSLN